MPACLLGPRSIEGYGIIGCESVIVLDVLVTPREFLTRPPSEGILATVGFDPNRKYNAKPFDYALVGICLVIAAALVVWAFVG